MRYQFVALTQEEGRLHSAARELIRNGCGLELTLLEQVELKQYVRQAATMTSRAESFINNRERPEFQAALQFLAVNYGVDHKLFLEMGYEGCLGSPIGSFFEEWMSMRQEERHLP